MGLKERFCVDIMAIHPEVTGSLILVIVKYPDGKVTKFIVDCGEFTERNYFKYNESFPFKARNVDFCFLTHIHKDHMGRLPLLTKKGFEGKIYSSFATKRFADPALNEYHTNMRDIAKRNNTCELYSEIDVEKTKTLFEPCDFDTEINSSDERIKFTLSKSGHVLGAAMFLVQISYLGYEDINILFTGDYNNKNMFFDVPELPKWVLDLPLIVVQESTYGKTNSTEVIKCFKDNVSRCVRKGGTAVCMVSSFGGSQEILYMLKNMQDSGKLKKNIPIYFDGKRAHQNTDIYLKENVGIKDNMKVFLPENLVLVDKDIRQYILDDETQKIIVTTSAKGTYGASKMYIQEYITRENCLLQFTKRGSFVNKLINTPIGCLIDFSPTIQKEKRAEVTVTTENCDHAKADELIDFLRPFNHLKMVLVNHGEQDTKKQYAARIEKEVNPQNVAILDRDYFFRISSSGQITSLSTKFN